MGSSLSAPLLLGPFDDPEIQRARMKFGLKRGNSPSTSSSSLASTASMVEATGAIIMGTNAPLLYEHALVGDWDALLRRVEVCPKEAYYRDKCQNMPLHVACRRQPPPEVVEALIKANPESLIATTVDGLTPLHFGCFCGSSPETIKLILGYETSLREMVDRRGRTPLHCVCAGFRSPHRLPVVKLLLEADTSCATAFDERGRTPLSLIVDDYVEELHDALRDKRSQDYAYKATLKGGELYDCWQVVTILLRAAYGGTLEDDCTFSTNEVHVGERFSILHAAVGIGGCPAAIIRLIMKMNPRSVEEQDSDLNLPLHVACKTIGTPWSRKVLTTKKSGVIVYNSDFGKAHPTVDVTCELIQAFPQAAREMDDAGKVPFILAVESGKPWATSLKPLWDAYTLDLEGFDLLEKALHGGLASLSVAIRTETVQNLKHIIPLWPLEKVDQLVKNMIEFAGDAGIKDDDPATEIFNTALLDSALQGLAQTLHHVKVDSLSIRESLQFAFDMVLPLLGNRNETTRICGAKVLGAVADLMGAETTERAMNEVIFPISAESEDDCSISTMGGLSCSSYGDNLGYDAESDDVVHGRAMACYYILHTSQTPRTLSEYQKNTLRSWMKHESKMVRRGACWVVGATLSSTEDLKNFKSPILKCMRHTEDISVHLALSKSLTRAAKKYDKLFLCKAGVPVLDSALMLSMSRGTPAAVQQAFHLFLWHALQKHGSGLQEYMDMAEGENGRIMMSLVTKNRLPAVLEDRDEEDKEDT